MKKFIIILIVFLFQTSNISADDSKIKRITVGNKKAKITILAYESLTCSHCANFHINVYPELKRDYIDTVIAKIEFRHFPLDIAAFNASKNHGRSGRCCEKIKPQHKYLDHFKTCS